MDSEFYKYLREGRKLMQSGRFAEAIVALEKSIAEEPVHRALKWLGECLIQLDRHREALIPLAAATSLGSGADAPSLLAEVLCQIGRNDEAINMALCALARDVHDERAYRILNHYAEAHARYYPLPSREGAERFTILFSSVGVTTRLHMTPLGDGLFRLEQSPPHKVGVSATDVIQAQTRMDGSLVFQKVAVESLLRYHEYFLWSEDIESPRLRTVLDEVDRQGGHWEFANPGCLVVRLPQDCAYDPDPDINRLP